MPRFAFLTCLLLKDEPDAVAGGFGVMRARCEAAAGEAPGLIAASWREPERFGTRAGPCFAGRDPARALSMTLSVWTEPEAVQAYTYGGVHLQALRRRTRWVEVDPFPTHVAWWVEEGPVPDWAAAVKRLERLFLEGNGPEAFTLKGCFGPDGKPWRLDRARVAALAPRPVSETME